MRRYRSNFAGNEFEFGGLEGGAREGGRLRPAQNVARQRHELADGFHLLVQHRDLGPVRERVQRCQQQ